MISYLWEVTTTYIGIWAWKIGPNWGGPGNPGFRPPRAGGPKPGFGGVPRGAPPGPPIGIFGNLVWRGTYQNPFFSRTEKYIY